MVKKFEEVIGLLKKLGGLVLMAGLFENQF